LSLFSQLPPFVFIGKTKGGGRPPTTPVQGVRGRGGHRAAAPNCPRGTSPSFLHHVANKWGCCVSVFLRFRGQRERRKAGRKILPLPLPHASRGRRRPTVPSKRHRSGLLFF